MYLKKILFFFALIAFPFLSDATLINIGIFNSHPLKEFAFTAKRGSYSVFASSGEIIQLVQGSRIKARISDKDSVELFESNKLLGSFSQINFIAEDKNGAFSIKPQEPNYRSRDYDDNLILRKQFYTPQLQLINNLTMQHYIAGVVQAEVGTSPPSEYFKVQAVICRTYALKNWNRHSSEGFNLCDNVHCQAYHGATTSNRIMKAVKTTKNLVVVDSNMNYITAVFSSNCGGQTTKSQDIWTKKLYYLQSVKDTFCLHSPHAHWQKTISLSAWKKYLSQNLICCSDSTPQKGELNCFSDCKQPYRMVYFYCGGYKLSLEKMRHDFHLNSTFFSVNKKGNKVVLNGRGFGHGIGLCQEGAIEMSKDGYNFINIINHYYTGVFVVKKKAIALFKEQ